MSGRSRGRKSSRAKSRGKGRAKARVRAAPGGAARDPDAARLQSPGEDTQVAQGQASAGGGGPKPADASRLPLDCGLALRARAAGGCAVADARPGPGRATSFAERLAADTIFVGTVGPAARLKTGPRAGTRRGPSAKKVPEKSCGSAGGKPKKAAAGECSPVSDEEERTVVEMHSRAGPLATEGDMDTLETVQLKLETMNAQADRAYLRLSRKFGQLRLHHLERRNVLIKNIPGFWGQAFQNHPQLSSFLNSQDKEVLSYLNSLEVEELGLARLGYKIKFYFGRNPYFQNKVLIKEYGCGPSGQVISRSTPIQWLPGHDLHSMSEGNLEKNRSFFGWFVNHSSIESDKIVEIINEELWPNPLQYYLMSEGARGEKAKEGRPGPAKQPVESPAPGVKPSS
uniref:TSPY like 5 n=1 Tax=Chinchilla lanigera TaxID=34839 RepID=A0A8C2V730_CHILA